MTRLFGWHFSIRDENGRNMDESQVGSNNYKIYAHGAVLGHPYIENGQNMHSSSIEKVWVYDERIEFETSGYGNYYIAEFEDIDISSLDTIIKAVEMLGVHDNDLGIRMKNCHNKRQQIIEKLLENYKTGIGLYVQICGRYIWSTYYKKREEKLQHSMVMCSSWHEYEIETQEKEQLIKLERTDNNIKLAFILPTLQGLLVENRGADCLTINTKPDMITPHTCLPGELIELKKESIDDTDWTITSKKSELKQVADIGFRYEASEIDKILEPCELYVESYNNILANSHFKNKAGKLSKMRERVHLGMHVDSYLIQDFKNSELDYRYWRENGIVTTYHWSNGLKAIKLRNMGTKELIVNGVEEIRCAPGEITTITKEQGEFEGLLSPDIVDGKSILSEDDNEKDNGKDD